VALLAHCFAPAALLLLQVLLRALLPMLLRAVLLLRVLLEFGRWVSNCP
jgi:hypothetical protein